MARGGKLLAAVGRFTLFLVLWWSLAEGGLHGWSFALLVAAAATASSLALLPPPTWRVRLLTAPGFLGFFLREMLLGGVDVARRALHPGLPISPGFLTYPLRLEQDASRLFMAWTVSLLPGTVTAGLQENELVIHVLDKRLPVLETVAGLEARVGRLFGDQLP